LISKTRAAEIFCVPKTTLLRRLKGIKSWLKTHTNGLKLHFIEEEVLLKRLKVDKQGFPIRLEFLRGIAQILLCKCLQDHTASLDIN
jgi:hypothetical protein